MLEKFRIWLSANSKLSENSIGKYIGGFRVISREMLAAGIISKPLEEMNLTELDQAYACIFSWPSFIEKNKRGNHMYSNALKHYRCYFGTCTDSQVPVIEDLKLIESDGRIDETEREALVKARVGQGIFREELMGKYNGKCIITGISIPQLLIASHVKPWAVSNNKERLSRDNGLLLSATYDKLFDNGLISFKPNGEILISSVVKDESRRMLGIAKKQIYDIKAGKTLKINLEYHRDSVFVK